MGAVAGMVAGGRGGGGRRRALGIRVSRGCRGPPVLEDSAAAAVRPAAVGEGVRQHPRPGGAGRAVGGGRRRWQASRRGRVGTYPYADGNRVLLSLAMLAELASPARELIIFLR